MEELPFESTMRACVFLRQSLFTLPGDGGHVPQNAAVLRGEVTEQGSFGLRIDVESYEDERGKPLGGLPRTLLVPSSKIDHVWLEE